MKRSQASGTFDRRDVLRAGLAAAATSLVLPRAARADTYPSHPIFMYLPLAAGSSVDVSTRAFSNEMGEILKQPLVIENKPGADGVLVANLLLAAKPDGYTLMMTTPSHATNVWQYPSQKYDPLTSFTPIALVTTNLNILVVNASSPIRTFEQFIAYAKAHPGKMNFGSVGGSMQGSSDLLNYMAKIDTLAVSYRGAPAVVTDLLGGSLDFVFLSTPSAMPLIRSGKLRALAVSSPKRSPILPGVPAVEEFIPGYSTIGWYALYGPPKMPADIVKTLHDALFRSLASPVVVERLAKAGFDAAPENGPAELNAFVKSEIDKWKPVTKSKE